MPVYKKSRRRLDSEILDVSEREQQRIGRELHDGLCQQLAGIAFTVQSLQKQASSGGAVEPEKLQAVAALLQEAVRQARGLSRGLHPVDPQPNGLVVALEQLAADATDLFEVRCEFRCADPVELARSTAATHLYRIAHAALREAIGQGRATRVVVSLTRNAGGSVVLSVEDNGLSLSAGRRYVHRTVLPMMRHRARAIDARLRLTTGAGGAGVRATCELKDVGQGQFRVTGRVREVGS